MFDFAALIIRVEEITALVKCQTVRCNIKNDVNVRDQSLKEIKSHKPEKAVLITWFPYKWPDVSYALINKAVHIEQEVE